MSEQEVSCAFVITMLFIGLAIFGTGWCIGYDKRGIEIRQNMCKTFMTATNDYLRCNTKSIDDILIEVKR